MISAGRFLAHAACCSGLIATASVASFSAPDAAQPAANGAATAIAPDQVTQGAAPPSAPAKPAQIFDTLEDNVGIAQQTAAGKGLQARIIWVDAGANVGNLNTPEKIQAIVDKIKAAGMNMIVLDVKPIVGETIYPSKFAPRLTEWKGQKVSPDLDVLGTFLADAHAAGIPVYANMSTFGEGHKMVSRGLAYTHPEWQTTMYLSDRSISHAGATVRISVANTTPKDDGTLGSVTDSAVLKKNWNGYTAAILNFNARVLALVDASSLSLLGGLTIPPQGSALLGTGKAADWLKANAIPGEILSYAEQPKFVPVVDDPDQKYTMFCDPLNPDMRKHELDIIDEVMTNYPVDGMVFDDRMRYAGLNADFSDHDEKAFEAFVGKKLTWPDDVFRNSAYPGQMPKPGPHLRQWLAWRASNVTSWLTDAASLVRQKRPGAQVAVYTGSWYGDYYKLGSNWAASDFNAPYSWYTPEFKATGYAGLLDWITTGCYYYDATVAEATAKHGAPGATVEAAGQLSNRVVNDSTWTYAGLYAAVYSKHPEQFAKAIQAAAASSQGVMVFDISQIIEYDWWNVLGAAFAANPATAPNTVPGLLETVRQQHAADVAAGKPQAPLPAYQGVEDTGL